MPNVEGAYCAEEDMRTGDLATPSYTTKAQYVQGAAEEIEIALGTVYVTPFDIVDIPENQVTIKWLKKVNWLLASGRFILDVAAVGEKDNLHAYGKRMLDEATLMLGEALKDAGGLTGAEKLPPPEGQAPQTGPIIHNEDPESLVEGFYTRMRPVYGGLGESLPGIVAPVMPYGP